MSSQASLCLRRFFMLCNKNHLAHVPLLLLSAKFLVCCACSLVNALTTASRHYHTFAALIGFNSTRKNPKNLFSVGQTEQKVSFEALGHRFFRNFRSKQPAVD